MITREARSSRTTEIDVSAIPSVAYLGNYFPQVSNMFLVREVKALRKLGVPLRTFTVRVPDRSAAPGKSMGEEYDLVTPLLPMPTKALVAAVRLALTKPKATVDTLRWSIEEGRRSGASVKTRVAYVVEALELLAHCRRDRISHIHAQFATNAADIAQLTVRLGRAIYPDQPWHWSFTVHGPDEFFAIDHYRLSDKVADADAVVAISKFCRSQLMLVSHPEDWKKITIVGCGLDRESFDPDLNSELACLSDTAPTRSRYRLVFVGRLVPAKGVPVLFDAFDRLIDLGVDAELVVVGGRGHGSARGGTLDRQRSGTVVVDDLLAQTRHADRITLTGALSQELTRVEIANSDVLVLPSFAEGLPVVLMEAMALGKPVITSRIAAHAELVDHSVGRLVDASDVEALVEAMKDLSDPQVRAPLEVCAQQKVWKDHDIDVEARKFAAMLVAVAQHSDQPKPAGQITAG